MDMYLDCFGLVDFVSLLETVTELLGCMVTMVGVLMGMVLGAIARFFGKIITRT